MTCFYLEEIGNKYEEFPLKDIFANLAHFHVRSEQINVDYQV